MSSPIAKLPEPPTAEELAAFEAGELDEDALVALFQKLVDTGLAWSLQGHYGRTAVALIERGLVLPAGNRKVV